MYHEVLRIENIFESNILKNVSLNVFEGEIHIAVIRTNLENELLVNLLSGQLFPEKGRVYLGDSLVPLTEQQFYKLTTIINIVTKESVLMPNMPVYKSLFYSEKEYSRFLWCIDSKKMIADTSDLLANAGITDVAPTASVYALSDAQKNFIEIAKSVHNSNTKLIVLNNITSEYTEIEMINLKRMLLNLKDNAHTFLILTNKYNELVDICDRLTLIDSGITLKTLWQNEVSRSGFRAHLSTQHANDSPSMQVHIDPDSKFSACNISTSNGKLHNLSFDVGSGEILGIWDVNWNCYASLSDTLLGRQSYSGRFTFGNKAINIKSPRKALKAGIALHSVKHSIEEAVDGIYSGLDIFQNVTMLMDSSITNALGIVSQRIERHQTKYVLDQIDAGYLFEKYKNRRELHDLSLSERMKIIIARYLCTNPRLFVFVNPYMNFDDLTIYDFKHTLECLKKLGMCIIIIHMNHKELAKICDRIIRIENGIILAT
ncbi:MAG: hypothetical protein ACOYJC_07545 [Christensenellales bacterium]|jgi:ABC-type sugar transport system ATPase subunit